MNETTETTLLDETDALRAEIADLKQRLEKQANMAAEANQRVIQLMTRDSDWSSEFQTWKNNVAQLRKERRLLLDDNKKLLRELDEKTADAARAYNCARVYRLDAAHHWQAALRLQGKRHPGRKMGKL